jgi:Cof subfamily protein (haloacid dehalogenase superfamily)
MYKIVFLDIDGTILRPDDTIEASTRQAISILQSKGITVVLATGRPLHEITELGKELNIQSFIAYNGAYAIIDGKEVFKENMLRKDVEKYYSVAIQHRHDIVFFTHEKNYFTNLESDLTKGFMKTFHLTKNDRFNPSILDDVLSMTIITNEENASRHYKSLGDNYHFAPVNVTGFTNCLDVIRDRVNKGIAVKAVLAHFGYGSESAIAFGDGMNDKEMLSTVGEGFAMGSGHPDLQQYAKHVTTSVMESGVYNGLFKLGLLE